MTFYLCLALWHVPGASCAYLGHGIALSCKVLAANVVILHFQ